VDVQGIALVAPGWVEVGLTSSGDAPRVLVKFTEREGRSVITRVVILGDAVDSATYRAIPIGRIESVLNPAGRALSPPPFDQAMLDDLAGINALFPGEFAAIDGALDSFQQNSAPVAVIGVQRKSHREPLARPDGTDPEGFSRRVAAAYSDVVATTPHPAKVLAEEAGVPVTTVHRWILEARRRGFLPRARKGRAG